MASSGEVPPVDLRVTMQWTSSSILVAMTLIAVPEPGTS